MVAEDVDAAGLVPFETIVRKGVLLREIEDRRQGLVDQCRTSNGLTLQEVMEHRDWLWQVERDLSKARARIERDFRISNALSLKVREGKRKEQLQQRLDVLRSQCDVLNESIHGLSDHCAWFQESGTYREAVEYLEGRWDDDEGGGAALDDACLGLRGGAAGDRLDSTTAGGGAHHHELSGLIRGDPCANSAFEKKGRRKKRRRGKGVIPGGPDEEAGGRTGEQSEEEEDGDADGPEPRDESADGNVCPPPVSSFVSDFGWLRAAGRPNDKNYIDVWMPD